MQRFLVLVLGALLVAASHAGTSPAGGLTAIERASLEKKGYREFTSADGSRTLFAKVTDIEPDLKKINMTLADGRDLQNVAVTAFSAEDQAYFKQWAKADYFLTRESFTTRLRRRQHKEAESGSQYFQSERNAFYYSILIENERNLPLEGARLEYRIYVMRGTGGGLEDERPLDVTDGSVSVPLLAPFKEVEIATEAITLLEYKAGSGAHYINAEGDYVKKIQDEVRAVWIRLYQGDTMIYERSKPDSFIEDRVW
jgi:hypothetical protein